MMRALAWSAAALAAAAVLPCSVATAQSPTAVQAAKDATKEAKDVTYGLMGRSGSATRYGNVTLRRIGGTRTRVRVTLTNPATGASARLRPGSDCTSPRVANAPHSILLNPFTGRVSETIVNLPLANLQSGKYLVDVQRATARQQALDACARIGTTP